MSIELVAGNVGLDLANNRQRFQEFSPDRPYLGLLEIAIRARTLSAEAADKLTRAARRRPAEAAAVAARADALAAVTKRLVEATIDGRLAPSEALATINREVAEAASRACITSNDVGFERCWKLGRPLDLARPLWPLARAVADLLVGDDLKRVSTCRAADCDWLFVDASKNHSRCWCDMATCGNRAKAQRFRERTA